MHVPETEEPDQPGFLSEDKSVLKALFSKMSTAIGLVQGLALCGIIGLILMSIILRNFFDYGIVWVFEVSGFLMVSLVFLGVPKNLFHNEDIAVDFVTSKVGPAAFKLAWYLKKLIILAVSIIFVWYLAEHSQRFGQLKTPTLEIPHQIFYMSVFIGPLLAIFVVSWQLAVAIRGGALK